MREVDNNRIQSVHMQALRCILGIKWYDKVSSAAVRQRTKLPDLPSLIADRRHSLFGHVCRPASQPMQLSIDDTHTESLTLLLLQTGNDHRVVQGERDCNKSKRTAGYLLVSPRSQAKIARCGDRYDSQLVKRSSE